MPTAIIYRDGKTIRTTTLSATQGEQFTLLAAAVRDTQAMLTVSAAAKGSTHKSDIAHGESHGADIYAALLQIDELLGKSQRSVYSHLDQNVTGEVLRNPDGTPLHGLMLASKNVPIPRPEYAPLRAVYPGGEYTSMAQTLGMIPLDGLKFDYTELTDAPPAGSGLPQVRAYVRWRV